MSKPVQGDRGQLLALMARQRLVDGLDRNQCERLLASAIHCPLPCDQYLFHQGDPATHFFLVTRGRLKLYRLSVEGQQKIIGLVGPDESFAEGILFMDTPLYPVNAWALEPSTVVGLNRETYLALLRESFPTCLSVMAKLTERIQSLLNEVESLTLGDSRYRVVRFLVRLMSESAHENTTVYLPARKTEIAARLSIRPETLSRALTALSNEGLIEIHNHSRVDVPNAEALRQLLI